MADLKYRIEGGHVAIRRKDDMRGETFERWRFTILPDIGGRYDLIGEWMDFFGQLGVSWPPGTYAERSGDDGLVVRNTPENLNLIRMIFGALSVNVLRGDPVVLEDAPATNAPAATLEQLIAEPWRKRLSPDADPVAEMRKIGTLDAFADTRVLFLGAGVCLHHLRNDPEDIAPERDRCNLVRELFRETRPAAGIHFARGGSSRTLVFDVLPREGDPEWPDPVRAVPFEFDAFAPADFPEDLVVRLPGEDRWVRVPGLGEVAMPWRAAAHFLDTLVASFAVDSDANAIDIELADHKYKGLRFEECAIGEIRGVPRVERIQTLRSSFRLGAGRCVEFAEHHFGFIFSAYPRDGLPDDIRAALGPPETAPGPFLVVTRIGGFRRNYPMRYVLVPEDSPAAPNALRFSLGRFLLWPLDEDPEPHAAPAEEEPHAESAENAEPDPHAEPAWGDAMYFLDLLEWQKRNPDAFAAALAALAKDFDMTLFAAFATNVPCWPPPESPSFDEVLHALPDFASFRTGRGWGVPTEPLPPELEAAVRESLRRAVRTDTPPEALRFGTERETWPEDGWCVDAHWHTAAFEARFPGRGFCPFGHGSGGSYSERFLAYRSPDSVEDALFALFPGTYRAPGLAALLDRAHPPSGAAEETHAESAEPGGGSGEAQPPPVENHAESAMTQERLHDWLLVHR
jgi:hypothetical protein